MMSVETFASETLGHPLLGPFMVIMRNSLTLTSLVILVRIPPSLKASIMQNTKHASGLKFDINFAKLFLKIGLIYSKMKILTHNVYN